MESNVQELGAIKSKFLKLMGSIDSSKSQYQVFDDFLTLAYCALSKAACIGDRKSFDETEERYLQVIAQYRPEDQKKFPDMFALTAEALNHPCDFLGEVAGDSSVLNSRLGQFFTPYHLCRAMAMMTAYDIKEKLETRKFVTVQEPAVGAGAMILALFDVLKELGVNPQQMMWVDATDVSEMAYKMAYIQLCLKGVAGVVRHGNSLSLETYTIRKTALGMLFLLKHRNPYKGNIKLNTTAMRRKFTVKNFKKLGLKQADFAENSIYFKNKKK